MLEAGADDRSLFIRMPTALSIPMNTPRFNWGYWGQPEPHLDGRRMDCARGKVLGGSSAINGMVYVRGHASDFDQWEAAGAAGWSYADCLPYFQRAERWMGGSDRYRGGSGPVDTCNGNNMRNPLYKAFIDAGQEAGYGVTDDYNGYRQEGFGPMHMTVKNGVRWSTANAYLKPALSRPNLTVITHALVHKVLLSTDGDGSGKKVATGIRYERKGKIVDVKVNKEVILSAGPIGSPHILQLSGIGPKAVLKDAGIELKHDLPGVGENLQDHLEFYFQFKCKKPISLNGELDLWRKFLIGTRWILTKKGLGSTNHFESCGFIRSKENVEWPDLQYHFLPAAMRYDGKEAFAGHGFQVHIGHNKPKSRGFIRATFADPKAPPQIQFNYLEHEADREGFRACVRLTREIIHQAALDEYRGEEIQPGIDIQTDEEIDSFVRQFVESAYHPSCSCKMGTDELSVVDPHTKVHGINGLRVVDSSIFTTIPNGNLNAPTIMVAERAADFILGRDTLPPSTAEVSIAPNWQQEQRTNKPNRKID